MPSEEVDYPDAQAMADGATESQEAESCAQEDGTAHKKPRYVWSAHLHRRFEEAVAQLGIDAAKPQTISQLMGVEGENAPSRQNIKSHLQKYRLMIKKRAGGSANACTTSKSPALNSQSGHNKRMKHGHDNVSLGLPPIGAIMGPDEQGEVDFSSGVPRRR